MGDINYFARTDFRNENRLFGIRRDDRRLHMYVIGRTGMGKSVLLQNMVLNDIYAGEGLCFIDPHGDAVETLLDYIPESRLDDVIYLDPADLEHPIPINVLENVPYERRHLLVSGVISIFRRLFNDHWQHRQEHILRNVLLGLLDIDNATLLDAYGVLSDWRYRRKITERVRDPVVKSFWTNEFSRYAYQSKGEALAPLLNKLGAFLTSPLMRNIVGQPSSTIDFRQVIDGGKVLLVNVAQGRIGEDASTFIGALIIAKLHLAAIGRIDLAEDLRRDFYLYVDEFPAFMTQGAFESILSGARKHRLCLTISHQYIDQLDEELRKAVFGNVGTIVAFPVGAEDSTYLEKQFLPAFRPSDLIEHPKYHVYVKLAVNGQTSRAFSAVTLPPFWRRAFQGQKGYLIQTSRAKYAQRATALHNISEAPHQYRLI